MLAYFEDISQDILGNEKQLRYFMELKKYSLKIFHILSKQQENYSTVLYLPKAFQKQRWSLKNDVFTVDSGGAYNNLHLYT